MEAIVPYAGLGLRANYRKIHKSRTMYKKSRHSIKSYHERWKDKKRGKGASPRENVKKLSVLSTPTHITCTSHIPVHAV